VLIKIGNAFEFETPNGIFLKLGKFHIHMTRSDMFDWKPVVQRDPKGRSWDVWFMNRQAVVDWA
jgi:hypothetical protein